MYILTILTLLLIPTAGRLQLDKYFLGIRTDHFIHATMFLPFMVFFWIRNMHRGDISRFFAIYLIGIAFAAFCESLHYFVKYRSFDIQDFYANLTGLTIGNVVFLFRSPRY